MRTLSTVKLSLATVFSPIKMSSELIINVEVVTGTGFGLEDSWHRRFGARNKSNELNNNGTDHGRHAEFQSLVSVLAAAYPIYQSTPVRRVQQLLRVPQLPSILYWKILLLICFIHAVSVLLFNLKVETCFNPSVIERQV